MTASDIVVADHPGRSNWAHWLLQVCPQIARLGALGAEKIAVHCETETHRQAARAIAEAAGVELIERGKIEWMPTNGMDLSPETITMLRKTFLTGEPETYESDAVFISRDECRTRKLRNQRAVAESFGCVQADLEAMSVRQQAWLFNGARKIVGLHGSGFANLVFCHPGVHVIEIKPRTPERGWVARLTEQIGGTYELVECEYEESDEYATYEP